MDRWLLSVRQNNPPLWLSSLFDRSDSCLKYQSDTNHANRFDLTQSDPVQVY